jgi:membrane associated rhomboid family serine protease
LQGVLASTAAAAGGIAWWAHIGGFLFGVIMAKPFTIGQKSTHWYPDQYYPY